MSARSMRRARKRELEQREKRERRFGARSTMSTGAGAALGATVLFAPPAEAATFTVTNLNDDGAGSLRQAVLDAEAATGADTVSFQSNLSGTIALDDAIEITEELSIQGPGTDVISIDSGDSFGIFYAHGSDEAEFALTISGLTLTGGDESSGGALYTDEVRLALSNMVFTGNYASRGGAVYSTDGSFTMESSTVANNTSSGRGGGLHIEDNDAGDIVIRDSSIAGNTGSDGGGLALYDLNRGYEGDEAFGVVIERTAITGNTATGFGGGGIYIEDNYGDGGDVVIDSSTISGNTATTGSGGGILLYDDLDQPVTIRNSTVSGNTADNAGGGIYFSGAGDVRSFITSSTVADNTAGTLGGGIFRNAADDGNGTDDVVEISNSIVSDNDAQNGPDVANGAPAFGTTQIAFTLVENVGGADVTEAPVGSNLLGTDPQLGPLASNGGPTQTHLPALTSPVLDGGVANGLPTDQRGLARTFDVPNVANRSGSDATDIGAVELAAEGECKGRPATVLFAPGQPITGSDEPDVIVGTTAADQIDARGGKDTICARGGNDKVKGGAGNDRAFGEGGKDRLSGNAGKDILSGQAGKDTLKGGGGKDKLKGGGGKDKLRGGPGKDRLIGGPGKDSEQQ